MRVATSQMPQRRFDIAGDHADGRALVLPEFVEMKGGGVDRSYICLGCHSSLKMQDIE